MSDTLAEHGPTIQKPVYQKMREYVGKKVDKIKNWINPSLDEQDKIAQDLLTSIERSFGFLRRTNVLTERDNPQARDILLSELSEEGPIKSGVSRNKKLLLFALSVPAALYGTHAADILTGHGIQGLNLHPTSEPRMLDLEIINNGYCSVDLYNRGGELLQTYSPSAETLKVTNFSTDTLVGSNCSPGQRAQLHITDLDDETKVLDLVAWSAYLQHQSKNWYREAMDIDKAHTITTGNSSVSVAVVETNFDPNHLEFVRQKIQSFTSSGEPYVDIRTLSEAEKKNIYKAKFNGGNFEHGTATTGLIAAEYQGIAPNVSTAFIQGDDIGWVGTLTDQDVEAFKLAIDKGVSVISYSMSPTDSTATSENLDKMRTVFQTAQQKGVYIFISAGNNGDIDPQESEYIKNITNLASLAREFPNVYLVESTDKNGTMSGFSSAGEIAAPGEDIIAPVRAMSDNDVGHYKDIQEIGQPQPTSRKIVSVQNVIDSGYEQTSGTSFSAPLAAGAAALALSIDPSLRYDPERMTKILNTSEDLNHGFGMNAWYIVLLALQGRYPALTIDLSTIHKPNELVDQQLPLNLQDR